MPSTSASSTESPISKLPYDILREIFIHCLPPEPRSLRRDRYPDPIDTIAPMLLCHICSSWRTVALTSPTLWTCLSYIFTVVIGDDFDEDGNSTSGTSKFVAREIEFVRWWSANQGHVSPHLNFSVCEYGDSDLDPREEIDDATSDSMEFLLEAIFAARFLNVDELFWRHIEDRIRAGHRAVFPNLHTLLMKQVCTTNASFLAVLRLLPDHAFPALRRVSIQESVHLLRRWSAAVTHVVLAASVTPDSLCACLEEFPNLRWGWFDIECLPDFRHAMSYRERGCTLLQLATLRVSVDNTMQPTKVISALTLLFGGLHLPALRTLSLSVSRWWRTEDHRVLNDLDIVLRSTPALTTLCLDDNFLTLCAERIAAPHGDGPPIWRHAPQLAHVQLYVVYGDREMAVEDAVEMCVSCLVGAEGGWLGLRDPACPVRSLMIMEPTEYDQGFRDLIVERVRESAENARVVIQAPKSRSEAVYLFAE